jgi:hypothetical protein
LAQRINFIGENMNDSAQNKDFFTTSASTAAGGQQGDGRPSNKSTSTHLELRRYSRGSLYCKGWAKRLSLREVLSHIQIGGTIRVVDNRTKLDITEAVLRQLVAEDERLSKQELYSALRKRGVA